MSPHIWPKPFKYFDHVRLFLISLCAIISLIAGGLFLYLYSRTDDLMLQRVQEQAADYADLLLHMKMWNFDYGGVYVEKKGKVESNSYLLRLGINPDMKAEGGRIFTVRNHAIMINEISRRSEQQDGVKFHITSLKPLDPHNAPDGYERMALQKFAQGAREMHRIEGERLPTFRYLRPLYADQSCLECHTTQGYKIGSVIGAISITIPMDKPLRETNTNKMLILLAAVITVGSLVGTSYFLTWRLVIKLSEVQNHLKKQATTDELTGLNNRRQIMKRLEEEFHRALRLDGPLCLIILDIDYFKWINDTYGHPFGDLVLKGAADSMQASVRSYDIVGRVGGEEFMVIAPDTSLDEAVILAERVKRTVGDDKFGNGCNKVSITVSAGVTVMDTRDLSVDSLLKRADDALYKAKQEGRDRVAVL